MWFRTSIFNALAWEVPVEIHKETIAGTGEEVPLVQEVALWVLSGQANNCPIKVTSSHGFVELSENALNYRHWVELVAVD